MEEHGFLDWGLADPPLGARSVPAEERYIRLYRPGVSQGMQLSVPIGGHNITQVSYAPFRNAYLIPGGYPMKWPQGTPMPVWWLTPNGTVTEEAIPYHSFMASAAWRGFLPVKGGVLVLSEHIGSGTSLGHAGGYLARDGETRKVIAGILHRPTVSPDGCRVAFVHEPHPPTDVAHFSEIKMKILNLCDERKNGDILHFQAA